MSKSIVSLINESKIIYPHSLLLNLIFLFFINMEDIPKNEGERFIELEEEPGYFLSNQERLYNSKLKIFLKKQINVYSEYYHIHRHKYYIRHLMNKYFNDIQVDKLVPITKYGLYEFENYYFDKENQKVYIFKNNIYEEIKPHTNYNKFFVKDKNGNRTSFNLKKLNSLMK